MTDRQAMMDDEWLAVRDSGEIPEVAYHASLYYLTTDENGPRLQLSEAEDHRLLAAARLRYRDIILRDLLPENRGKSLYRGLKRSMQNWRRFVVFSQRQGVDLCALRQEAAAALTTLLETEMAEGVFPSASLNCSVQELLSYAHDLGLVRDDLPADLERLFP